MNSQKEEPAISLSIVSHGQGRLIRPLLEDIRECAIARYEILLTLNIPEDESFLVGLEDLPIKIIRNTHIQGFGTNHNVAFRAASGTHFVVVNPDIRLTEFQLKINELLSLLEASDIGVVAPAVYSSDGELQDSARRFPTVSRLIARKISGRKEPDYRFGNDPIDVDWVAGMFMVFRSTVYHAVGGFDERYFMYLEDVDLCKRLRAKGYRVVLVPGARVTHDAQRASRRKLKHFIWHLSSAIRFLSRP